MNKSLIKQFIFIAFLVFLTACTSTKYVVNGHKEFDPNHPKREFRGAWINTIGQSQYAGMNPTQMRAYFINMLDQLHAAGINALIFQVRPQADAFYKSDLEPWSRYLTGTQGKAPEGDFDPMAFLIEECHKRCMEFHAWLNPYRVTSSVNQVLAPNHIYNSYPERFVKYGTQIYFDPGIPENRDFICKVVKDIVMRYDVDAIHMDDYFYPYPIAGQKFPDDNSFHRYAEAQGFLANQRNDWRRNNVNLLIKNIKQTILSTKPWVRFGVSPFGIYRNKKNTPDGSGSETNGLQNYDDLYADVKLWVQNGWVDYDIPQLYWEIGHKAADYKTLISWWANNNKGAQLYIGQDIKRSLDNVDNRGMVQLKEKMELSRSYPTINGNCFWPGYEIMRNYKGIADSLVQDFHKYPALVPAYTELSKSKPKAIKKLMEIYTTSQHLLKWEVKGKSSDPVNAQYFVVYRFGVKEDFNIDQAKNIVAVIREKKLVLPYEGGKKIYKYVVTAVNVFNNESKGKVMKITL